MACSFQGTHVGKSDHHYSMDRSTMGRGDQQNVPLYIFIAIFLKSSYSELSNTAVLLIRLADFCSDSIHLQRI